MIPRAVMTYTMLLPKFSKTSLLCLSKLALVGVAVVVLRLM
jgi:hypothetical protein